MLNRLYAGSRCCHGRGIEVCSAAVDGRQRDDRGGKALVLERVAVGGIVALAPGRVIRAIAPPESDTEPASAWKGNSQKFASTILQRPQHRDAVRPLGSAWTPRTDHNIRAACIKIRPAERRTSGAGVAPY
jgi:hypothetical protein